MTPYDPAVLVKVFHILTWLNPRGEVVVKLFCLFCFTQEMFLISFHTFEALCLSYFLIYRAF